MNSKYDAIIIGSGHNGLTTAGYLAKSGQKVLVLERREILGGAVCTETMFQSEQYPQGFQMDVGSSAHIMIHKTPVIHDLELHKYGLEYINMDPIMSFPFPDGKGVLHFYKDIGRTLESIARFSPRDVQNYKDFIAFWGRVNKGVLNTFLVPPSGRNIISEMVKGQIRNGSMFGKGGQIDGLRRILSSYGQVVDEAFEHPYLKTALLWFAAQSGPTPDQSASGDFVGWQAMVHESGSKRPKGGSGMLTRAMARMIEAHGGEVRTASAVDKILINNSGAYGVILSDGEEILAERIVSNAHVQTTMLKMVGAEHLQPSLLKRVRNINVGNGIGMVLRCAVEELPEYTACPDDRDIHNGLQLLCPSREYMNNAIGDYQKGLPPEKPAVIAMTFSKIDTSLCPPDTHILFAWAQWYPYKMSNRLHWDDIKEREAQKIYDVVSGYAPNMKGKLIDWYIQSPLDIERKHGLINGNVMHVEMTFDQMFMFRPTPEMSRYKTPVKNLYLSSASCHPGGGVFAAAGYNAAQVILKDSVKKKWF